MNKVENLFLEGYQKDFSAPTIDFNAITGVCWIKGQSFLEDTLKFYNPITDWIVKYIAAKRKIELNFDISYFNTSSQKRILDILTTLKTYRDEGGDVQVMWYVADEDIYDEADDLRLVSELDFEIIQN